VGTSSSAKKVARLAQRGKGKKVRFQGGSVFPLVVAAVVVLGVLLVMYSRASVPGLDAEAAADLQVDVAHGVYLCDEWLPVDALSAADDAFEQFGVIELRPGVVRMQPLPADRTLGARVGSLVGALGMELNDSRLRLPEGAADEVLFEEGTTKCNNRDAVLSVVVWDDAVNSTSSRNFITAFGDIRLPTSGMAVAIAFTEPNAEIPQPPSVQSLVAPPTTEPTDTTEPADTTEPTDTTEAPGTTAP
jgi:hypothetical protein